METKQLSSLFEKAEKWKKILETLIPDSLVEINIDTKEKTFFIWCFDNKLSNGFNQNIKMEFFLNGIVEVKTQSGLNLENLNSFEEAEEWILGYFNIPTKSQPEPGKILAGLPDLKNRKEVYQKWDECLGKLKPYGVEVYIESEYHPFSLYLPTIESVMRNDGEFETRDSSVDLDQGDDWAQVIKEKVIPELKKIYDLSISGIPDFSKELEVLKISEEQKKLYPTLNPWIHYFQELSKNVPFIMSCRDIWASIGAGDTKCYFDGEKIIPGVKTGEKHGLFSIPFEYSCSFNIDTFPVRIFSGKLTFFERNTAVLEFSGTSMWGMQYVKEDSRYHLQGRYSGAKGFTYYLKDIDKIFISGTWFEVCNKFNELIIVIIELFGEAMKVQPEVLKSFTKT